jgi:hypothetical protein
MLPATAAAGATHFIAIAVQGRADIRHWREAMTLQREFTLVKIRCG